MNTKIEYNGKYIYVSDARLMFRNFAGEAKKFNVTGNRNFHLRLDRDLAEGLLSDFPELNIKFPESENGEEALDPHVAVKISTKNGIENIYKIIGNRSITLTERTLGTLDRDRFENVDLVLRPYNWEVNGKTGTSLYLQKGYFTVEEDIFSKKYSNMSFDVTNDEEVPF